MRRSLPLFLLASAAVAGDGTTPITGPNWSFEPNQAGANLSLVRAAGDVNGDGYSDVIASAPLFDATHVDAGRAWLFLGGPNGASSTPAWTSSGPDSAGASFGSWISTAGDVDGDGYDDVLVVAQRFDDPDVDEGAVWLYRGSASGLSATPSWSFEGNQPGLELASASYAGDLNHDGYDDVVVGAVNPGRTGRVFLFYGRPTGLSATPDWALDGASLGLQAGSRFGSAVSTACDVNADGYDDFLVAASQFPTPSNAEGAAWMFLGGASLPSTTPEWFASGGELGAAFAATASNLGPAGDVNGDGYADVVVGAGEKGPVDAGEARVYRGTSAGLSVAPWVTLVGTQNQARFGTSASSAGDVNGDGFADLWIGSPDFVGTGGAFGRVQLFLGSASSVETPAIAEFLGWSAGATANDDFGQDAATLGDVNGDGYTDVGVVAPNRSNGELLEGRAASFHGCARGLRIQYDWLGSGPIASFFGAALDGGDFDGDGYSDLVVGVTGPSRVEVFRGGPTGPGTVPLQLGPSIPGNFSRFGAQVGAAGDVNGDGYCDLLVGAPEFGSGHQREGAVFLHLGGPSGLATTAAWHFESDQSEARLGFSIATGCDFDGDGLADVVVSAHQFSATASQEGRVYVFRGSRSGPPLVLAATFDGGVANGHLGGLVASAGDVDADGYGDILVGGGAGLPSLQLLRGSSTGLVVASWTYFGNVSSVEGAGDVNGDGFADIILAFPPRLFFGSPGGPSVAPNWAITTGGPSVSQVVAPAGDINADGYADVAIADPDADFPYWVGRAWIYLGGPNGPSTTPYWEASGATLFGFAQDSAIGKAMRGVGDVNGDGVGDFALGAPSILIDDYPPCRAVLYLGNKRGGPGLWPQARTASSLAPIAPLGTSESPSAFRIGARSANPAGFASTISGRRDVRLEWQVARLGVPFTSVPIGQGSFVPGVPVGAALALEELASGLEPGRALRWRARVASKSPLFPHSRWLSAPVFTTTETMLRTDHDCNANGIGDTTDVATGTSADANGNGVPDECETPVVVVCSGDGTGTACPCGNHGASGHGCAHSSGAAGAVLGASGVPSVGFDTFVLHGTGMPNTSSVLYFQGTALAQNGAGVTFGDGLRCAVGTVVRLGIGTNSGGASNYPGSASDAPISVQGQIPAGGSVTRHYQAWYRDSASFCTGLTFNLSNAVSVTWAP